MLNPRPTGHIWPVVALYLDHRYKARTPLILQIPDCTAIAAKALPSIFTDMSYYTLVHWVLNRCFELSEEICL